MDTSFLRRLSGTPPALSSPTRPLLNPRPALPPPGPSNPALHRHEARLQQQLQLLLDAQSAGLLAGRATPDDTTEPSTPTTPRPPPGAPLRAPPPPPRIPAQPPGAQPLGLRGARRGIARALREWAGCWGGGGGGGG
ncbi:MAG: hypothetical protein FRX48_08754 [Lasallia pustulata]|uniref:Uncharacterized protein n=1 Tax=Lasallia pustulata TaxID=136370 RepID=A0A5M8PDZ0_9LECA|nr:MAG: hypothetical protein FRX48_08754 [Lasallia pustulata]